MQRKSQNQQSHNQSDPFRTMDQKPVTLQRSILAAVPGLEDPMFKDSVIYLLDHTPQGALGLIVNKYIKTFDVAELLEGVIDTHTMPPFDVPVYLGGPVNRHQGFVLHDDDLRLNETHDVGQGLCLTTSSRVLLELSQGHPSTRYKFCLGTASWGPGQLDEEQREGTWMMLPLDHESLQDHLAELILDTPSDEVWGRVYAMLGITPWRLQMVSGAIQA